MTLAYISNSNGPIAVFGRQTRVQTQLYPIGDEGGEHNGGEKVAGELVISGSDAPEILEPAEAAFDDVAPFVGTLAEGVEGYSVGLVRNDRAGAAAFDVGAEVVAVIALVADEGVHGWREFQKRWRGGDIGVLAGS
jgi:hypothetical protein